MKWQINVLLIITMISLLGSLVNAELTTKNKWVLDKYDGSMAGNFTTDLKVNNGDARICLYPKAILSTSSNLLNTYVYLKKDTTIQTTTSLFYLDKTTNGLQITSLCINISSKDYNYIRFGDASIIYIYLTGAEELDSNRSYLRDIFNYVGYLDTNFTTISNGNYIKATFDTNLTSKNDIRILAKSNNISSVDVYLNNDVVANINNISLSKYYSTKLTSLGARTSDTFYLKCNGDISFDYIIDGAFCGGNLDCSVWNGFGQKAVCEAHSLCNEQGFVNCLGAGCEGYTTEVECIAHSGDGCSVNGYDCSNNGLCSDLATEGECNSYTEANCFWDATSPIISFVTPTPANNSQTTNINPIINVTISEANLQSAWVSFDDVNYSMTCLGTSPNYRCNYNFAGISLGQHNFTAYANDTGNQIGISQSRTYTITSNCWTKTGNVLFIPNGCVFSQLGGSYLI